MRKGSFNNTRGRNMFGGVFQGGALEGVFVDPLGGRRKCGCLALEVGVEA